MRTERVAALPVADAPMLAAVPAGAFVQKSLRENEKHEQISPKLSDERLAAAPEYIRVLVTAGGQ